MLTVKKIGRVDTGLEKYYEDLAADEYYRGEAHENGRWIGSLCAELGLQGPVLPGDLKAILRGYNPRTGIALATNAGQGHKGGWDLTFSSPKSVSVAWALAPPDLKLAIHQAHRTAVEEALSYIERRAFRSRDRSTRNRPVRRIVAAAMPHATSRSGDPQLHDHVLVANLSQREDGSWSALELDTRWKMAAGAYYRAALAEKLGTLGFVIERERTSFKIRGIDASICEALSQRRKAIVAEARRMNVEGAKALARVALETRPPKQKIDQQTLFDTWRDTAAKLGWTPSSFSSLLFPSQSSCAPRRKPTAAEVLNSLSQTLSTFTPMQLHAEALNRATGLLSTREIGEFFREIDSHADLVRLRAARTVGGRRVNDERLQTDEVRYTTQQMLQLETRLAADAHARRSEKSHIADATLTIASQTRLSEQQIAALRHITEEQGGVKAIQGLAGAGKTALLAAAESTWRRAGLRIRGCSLSGKAAQNLQDSTGIESGTIHSLLHQLEDKKALLSSRDVLVMDEAGMTGSRLMSRVLEHARRAGAKVVLVGDSLQLQPIDAGGAFRLLCQRLGHASLTEIRRQRSELDRQLVRDVASGNAERALKNLSERGRIVECDGTNAAEHSLVEHWSRTRSGSDWPLMIAGTREEVRRLNDIAREMLKEVHEIRNCAAVMTPRGEREFGEGDRILFTRNSVKLGVKNGTLGTLTRVSYLSSGELIFTVKPDRGVSFRFAPGAQSESSAPTYADIDNGFAVTTHKAQGATVSKAFVLASDVLGDREWSYVSLSRATDEVWLYADKALAPDLKDLFSRSHQKDVSLDYPVVEPVLDI